MNQITAKNGLQSLSRPVYSDTVQCIVIQSTCCLFLFQCEGAEKYDVDMVYIVCHDERLYSGGTPKGRVNICSTATATVMPAWNIGTVFIIWMNLSTLHQAQILRINLYPQPSIVLNLKCEAMCIIIQDAR